MAKSLGVYMTYVLRHSPQSIGIAMDTQGWVSVSDFLQKQHWHKTKTVSLEMLIEEAATDEKGRFELNKSQTKIRCVQGHSVEHVILNLQDYMPEDYLYHGTAEKNLAIILQEGLSKMRRKHVHISDNQTTAMQVGQRHGKPVVLSVDAATMVSHGYKFYRAENGVILINEVPPRYLRLAHE